MKRHVNKTGKDLVNRRTNKDAELKSTQVNKTIFLPMISPILEKNAAPTNYPKKSMEPKNAIIVL
jgi:hypothetical protein